MFVLFAYFFQFSSMAATVMWRASRRIERRMIDRHRQEVAKRELRSLDQYMLRDIGLSHREVGLSGDPHQDAR